MNTPSHLIVTAAIRRALPRLDIPRGAAWLGAVAPDLPLIGLSFGGMLYFRYWLGWERAETFRHLYGDLYFHDPLWISAHSLLHAPLLLALGLAATLLLQRRRPLTSTWLRWFLLSCLLHSAIDVFTHHNDGPLLLFPFEWTYRFASPISYWDSRHYGVQFTLVELACDVALLLYLAAPWLRRRFGTAPSIDVATE